MGLDEKPCGCWVIRDCGWTNSDDGGFCKDHDPARNKDKGAT